MSGVIRAAATNAVVTAAEKGYPFLTESRGDVVNRGVCAHIDSNSLALFFFPATMVVLVEQLLPAVDVTSTQWRVIPHTLQTVCLLTVPDTQREMCRS